MKRLGLACVALVLLSGCGGGSGSDGGGVSADASATTEPTPAALGNVSSVVQLRDALVKAGYDCANWDQDNVVKLAAESGTCDDSSVLSTFASQGDLQAQLDTFHDLDDMFDDAKVGLDPILVGPNWIFRAPEADTYAETLGGTISR